MKKVALLCCIGLAACCLLIAGQSDVQKPILDSKADQPTVMTSGDEISIPVQSEVDRDEALRTEVKTRFYALLERFNAGIATEREITEIQELAFSWNLDLPLALMPQENERDQNPLDQGSTDTVANCASATVIPSCPYNDSGTFDGDNDCGVIALSPYNEVFYTYTPATTGLHQLRVRSQSGGVGAVRLVSGGCCAGLVNVAFSSSTIATDCPRPDSAGNEPGSSVAYARATLTAGTQYWIHVGTSSATASSAAYQFSLWCVPCPTPEAEGPTHNTCATASAIAVGDSVIGDSAFATAPNAPDWYTFTTTTHDTVEFFVGGREFGHCNSGLYAGMTPAPPSIIDGRFTLYRDNGGACPGDSINFDDDSGCSFDSKKRICVRPGTYYLKIWNYSVQEYVLRLRRIADCPPPIDCATLPPCNTPAEVEPNTVCADVANFIHLACLDGQVQNFYGTICPDVDVDYFIIDTIPANRQIFVRLFQGPACDQQPPVGTGLAMRGATGAGGVCAAATGTSTNAYLIGSLCAGTPTAGGYIGVVRLAGPEQKYRIEVQCVSLVCPNVVLPKQYCSSCAGPINDVATVEYSQVVTLNEIIDDVNVRVDITHTFDGDIDMWVITPWSDTLELTTDNGGGGDNFQVTVFDDEGANGPVTAGVAPFNGSYIPEELLAAADGNNAAGTWRLRITDDAGGDIGFVNCWCLEFESHVPCTPTPVVEFTRFPIPQYACASLCTGSTTLIQICQDGGFDPAKPPIVTVATGCDLAAGSNCERDCTPADFTYDPNAWTIDATGCWVNSSLTALTNGCVCVSLEGFLAVNLNSFSAIAGDSRVTLAWSTATETNHDYFEVLRNETKVAELEGQGSPSSGGDYTWTDNGLVNGTLYHYTLVAVDVNGNRGTLGTIDATPVAPVVVTEYALHQNYPNPFNPTTSITFDLVESGFVSLTVYNMLGQEIAVVVNGVRDAGRHVVTFDATGMPSGLYLYRIEANGFVTQRKMLLMK